MIRLAHAFALPWTAFVAAFLYYTVLTLIAIGVADLPATFIAAYGLPVVAYVLVLAGRGVRALAAVRVDMGPLPYPSLR